MNLLNLLVASILIVFSCAKESIPDEKKQSMEVPTCSGAEIVNNQMDGCPPNNYPHPDSSDYVLPFPPGEGYPTGLTNCSSSFHSLGRGDAYAFDFNMPDYSDFHAIRAGTVVRVIENHPNSGDGTAGNYMVIDHGDKTFALYYHMPPNGVEVEVGDEVVQGQKLGVTGTSGYAGYPHLHLIVVKDQYQWPYQGIPISFKNVFPRHSVLKSYFDLYEACEY